MRILILNFILSTAVDGRIIRRESNADTMIYNMARGFVEAGHTVTLAAADDFRPLAPEDDLEFEVKYFPSRLPRIFKPHLLPAPKGFGRWLRRHADDYDMVLSVETFSIPTLIASRICPEKMIIWQEMAFHQHLLGGLPAKFWYNVVSPIYMRHIPVVAQSEKAKTFISQYMNSVSPNIVGHGMDSRRFRPSDTATDSFVIISMLVARKQIDGILQHFADFLANTPYKQYILNIVGEGPEKERLQQLTEELGITDNVTFHGFLTHDAIASLSRQAKALLINTRQDNNMVTVPESIVSGTPVLTNTVPNNSVFISENALGLVKDNWSWPELQEMVNRYDEFHANCIKHRDKFTNTGVAKAIAEEFNHAHD